MKIEMFGKEREITLKDCLSAIGQILVLIGFVELYSCYKDQVNAEGIAKMQSAIPAIVSMDGAESLPEKMKMISKSQGFYYGRCDIEETAGEKEIVTHYKREFQKHGWKYIGRYYSEALSPSLDFDGWYYYCFEKEGPYCMSFSLGVKTSPSKLIKRRDIELEGTKLTFNIDLKTSYDSRKKCQIEDEEP